MMRAQSQTLIGYFWAPEEYETDIRNHLSQQTATKIQAVKDNHNIMPPTFFKMTDLIASFQLIIDTYGIPTYKEANPTPVSIVTFPFMFGMMFGDFGHGSILAAFGLFLVLFNERL